jgi:Flp pilus assembly protein TadG
MRSQSTDRRSERGVVMVLVALALTTLLLFTALALDVGAVWASRTQSQNADDAAALAAASSVIAYSEADGGKASKAAALAAARDVAERNATVANPVDPETRLDGVALRDEDVQIGHWNVDTRTFTDLGEEDDPNRVNAVRVNVAMNGEANRRSPSFFSQLVGRNGFDVANTATAYLGYAGSWEATELDLPIAIDSWNLTGLENSCDELAFCNEVDGGSPPIACSITEEHEQSGDHTNSVSCIRFTNDEPGSRRNACWTSFDPGRVREGALMNLIGGGNPRTLRVGDRIELRDDLAGGVDLHNELISDIGDRFYGVGTHAGDEPEGDDKYAGPAGPDSWVVKLPVVESMNGHHCRGESEPAARVEGSVCFEIREVEYGPGVPIGRIKGRFLCPNSRNADVRARYNESCQSSGGIAPGGCNFGMRAARAVLVE